jgi:transcriptional regulator with XRE-family HTH domain
MAEHTKATLAQRLRAARLRRGLSREELAHAAGMSYGAIVQVESGRRTDNKISTVIALADALEVPLDYLLGRRENLHPFLDHQMLPYASDEEFLAAAVPFLEAGVAAGEPVLAVTSSRNIRLLRAAMDMSTITSAKATTWYRSPPAALAGYQQFVSNQIDDGRHWVRILGEPNWSENTPGEIRAWTRYEALLTIAFADMAATIVCPYDLRQVESSKCVRAARETHPFMLTGAEIAPNPDFNDAASVLLTDLE